MGEAEIDFRHQPFNLSETYQWIESLWSVHRSFNLRRNLLNLSPASNQRSILKWFHVTLPFDRREKGVRASMEYRWPAINIDSARSNLRCAMPRQAKSRWQTR